MTTTRHKFLMMTTMPPMIDNAAIIVYSIREFRQLAVTRLGNTRLRMGYNCIPVTCKSLCSSRVQTGSWRNSTMRHATRTERFTVSGAIMRTTANLWYTMRATENRALRLKRQPSHNLPELRSKRRSVQVLFSVARNGCTGRRFAFIGLPMSQDFGSGSLAAFLMVLHEDGEANRLPETITDRWAGTLDYHGYIQSPEWKEKAEAAKKRAGYRCQICNRRGKLEAHHRTYERLGQELPEDITVLCDRCHGLYSGEMEPEPCLTSTPF